MGLFEYVEVRTSLYVLFFASWTLAVFHLCFHVRFLQVGEMIKNREGVLHNGMTGKGLKVVHCYLDFLWQMGPQTLPNEGFRPEGVSSAEPCVVFSRLRLEMIS